MRASVAGILVSGEGLLTLEGRPEDLLGAEISIAHREAEYRCGKM